MISSLVVNSSPVICLSKAGLAFLLPKAASSLYIPEGVIEEVKEGSESDPGRICITENGEDFRVSISKVDQDIQTWLLGRGESEVLQWAKTYSCVALVDDYQARKCAVSLGIQAIGTLGFILKCKSIGLIQKVKPAVRDLMKSGLYVDQLVVRKILELAQES